MWVRVIRAAGWGFLIVLLSLLVTVVIAAFGPLPAWVLDTFVPVPGLSAPDRVKAVSDIRGSVLQAVGGILLVLGAVTAWRQMLVARSQHALGRRVAVTEAFTKAVEQLGNGASVAIRLGGIYSLDRIVDDDPLERARVAEVLSAFVRDRAAAGGGLPHDVAAALAVLTRRDWPNGVDLAGISLPGARLSRARLVNAHLDEVDLRKAVLTGAELSGSHLKGADLRQADLSGANLQGADVSGIRLSGAIANSDTRWPDGFAPGEHGVLLGGAG